MADDRTRTAFEWPAWERQVSMASTVAEYYELTVSIPDDAFPRFPTDPVAMNETPGERPTMQAFWERAQAEHGPDAGEKALRALPRIVPVSWPINRRSRVV